MKIRGRVILALLINMFVLVILQITLIEELVKYKFYGSVDNTTPLVTEVAVKEAVKQTESIVAEQNIKNTPQNVETKTVSTNITKDIGIVITNAGGKLHHSNLIFESNGVINVYYGKNLQNIKTYKNKITIKDKEFFDKNSKIKITSDKKIKIQGLSKAEFDGFFYVYKEKGGYVAINEIEMEKYLYGVVGSEMPSSFELEALKAQAVCARTYTYAHLENEKYKKYNAIMDDTVSYQAYANTSATKKVKKAVNETKGEVLVDDGELINAYYFSTSCGYTTDSSIWGENKYAYLKSKYVSGEENTIDVSTKDYFNNFIKNVQNSYEKNCAFYRWKVNISSNNIEKRINRIDGKSVGEIREITVKDRGAGGIVSEMEIVGNKGQCTLSNQNEIRKVFSPYESALKLNDGSERKNMETLPSAFFVIDKVSENEYLFTGGGFGHGSGMSQYGANEMAKNGKKYKEILEFFYSGVICDRKYIR